MTRLPRYKWVTLILNNSVPEKQDFDPRLGQKDRADGGSGDPQFDRRGPDVELERELRQPARASAHTRLQQPARFAQDAKPRSSLLAGPCPSWRNHVCNIQRC